MCWRHIPSKRLPPEQQRDQVVQVLEGLLLRVPGRQPRRPLQDHYLATGSLPLVVSVRLRRWARALVFAARTVAEYLLVPPWEGPAHASLS